MKTINQKISVENKPQSSEEQSRVRAIAIGIGLLISALVLGTILSLGPLLFGGMSSIVYVAILIVSEAGYALTAWIYIRNWFDETVTLSMPTKGQFGWILGSSVLMLAIGAGITMISTSNGITIGRADQDILTKNPITMLVLAVLSFAVIAPAEEYFFRGVIQRRLSRAFSPPVAIAVGALLFVLPHAIGYLGSVQGVLLLSMAPLTLAIITGILYERFDNLLIPILCHGIYDAALFLVTYYTAL